MGGADLEIPTVKPGHPASCGALGSAASATEQFRTARGAKCDVTKAQRRGGLSCWGKFHANIYFVRFDWKSLVR